MREKSEGAYLESLPNGAFGGTTRTPYTNRGYVPSATHTVRVSKKRLRAGRILSALPALFLLVDGAMKVVKPQVVMKTTVELGYAESVILPLGLVLLACTTLSLIRRTAVLGAILLTGYVGGAVASTCASGKDRLQSCFPSYSAFCSGRDWGCAMTGCAHACPCDMSSHRCQDDVTGSS
jgi:hypothetical protein